MNQAVRNEKVLDLLLEILDCGGGDLDVVLRSTIGFDEMVNFLKKERMGIYHVNDLIYAMIQCALKKLSSEIDDRAKELGIERVNLFEDVDYYIDGVATSVWIKLDREEFYQKHFSDILDKFYEMTGFSLI